MIPKDPVILLSYINTQLRDKYSDLDTLCEDMEEDRAALEEKLGAIGYCYQTDKNQFVRTIVSI